MASCRCWSRLVWTHLLVGGLCSGLVFNGSCARRWEHLRVTTWFADQVWGRHLFLLIVINDSKQSSMFRRSGARGRAVAGRRSLHRFCQHHSCLGWSSSHWSLVGESIVGGRRCLTVIFITAGVSVTPSSIIHRRVYPCRVFHAGRQ